MARSQRSRGPTRLPGLIVLLLAVAGTACASPSTGEYQDVSAYIQRNWSVLTRSLDTCDVMADPKLKGSEVLVLPQELPEPERVQQLRQACPQLQVQRLSQAITGPGQVSVPSLPAQGLLYLEHPYVVPGGMFNEMYGWDSYFILRGLLRDGQRDLAQGMVRNFFFEIEHYGSVLNANRTYYLTRSQPPFLTSMVMAIHDTLRGDEARAWLAEAYPYLVRDHALWLEEAHQAGDTGLSRYFDYGQGPVPELAADPKNYYGDVVAFFLGHPDEGATFLQQVDPSNPPPNHVGPVYIQSPDAYVLTADYYQGDRAMRESGFDVSFRFGPYSARTHHFAPVDLNSLLYKTETDLETISTLLDRPDDARAWHARAAERHQQVDRYLWDAQRGLYFDHDFTTGQRSTYAYATTFYPLWVGLASPEQARAVVNQLALFEQAGGLAMSQQQTGAQWDYPYGWAPVQLLAIEGLRRYGYNSEADRLSRKFLDMVAENFRREGTIHEKYNVVTRSSEVEVTAGYSTNVVGFGWTNGVFEELRHGLGAEPSRRQGRQPRAAVRRARPAAQ